MAESDLARRPDDGLAARAKSIAIASLPAVTNFVLGAAHVPAAFAISAAVAGAVAVRSALGGREVRDRVEDLEQAFAAHPLTLARVQALEEHLAAVALEAKARGATADQVRDALARPDIVFLLAQARDHYAVATMHERLRHHAAVIGARVGADAAAPFDRTLLFARAALDLEDVAIEFLAFTSALAERGECWVGTDAPGVRKVSTNVKDGEVAVWEFVSGRKPRTPEAAQHAMAAIDDLVRWGFAIRGDGGHGGTNTQVVAGRDFVMRHGSAIPTDLGRAFIAEIRRAGVEDVPARS